MSLDFFEKLFNVDALLASSRAAMMGGNKSNDEFISVYRRRLTVTEVMKPTDGFQEAFLIGARLYSQFAFRLVRAEKHPVFREVNAFQRRQGLSPGNPRHGFGYEGHGQRRIPRHAKFRPLRPMIPAMS